MPSPVPSDRSGDSLSPLYCPQPRMHSGLILKPWKGDMTVAQGKAARPPPWVPNPKISPPFSHPMGEGGQGG